VTSDKRQATSKEPETYHVDFQLATVEAHTLENLLDFDHETRVEDGTGELNVSEMAGALGHALETGLTFEVSVDR
jgi:hypothetical protein